MKLTYKIPVVFKVKAATLEEAEENVERLLRYGFESLSVHERPTWNAIKRWMFAAIRGRKI